MDNMRLIFCRILFFVVVGSASEKRLPLRAVDRCAIDYDLLLSYIQYASILSTPKKSVRKNHIDLFDLDRSQRRVIDILFKSVF